jgi:hypothetical protein
VNGERRDRELDTAAERALLAERFGIVLDAQWEPLPAPATHRVGPAA